MTHFTHTSASTALRELSAAESLAVSGGAHGHYPGPDGTGGRPRAPSATYGVPLAPPLWLGAPPSQHDWHNGQF